MEKAHQVFMQVLMNQQIIPESELIIIVQKINEKYGSEFHFLKKETL